MCHSATAGYTHAGACGDGTDHYDLVTASDGLRRESYPTRPPFFKGGGKTISFAGAAAKGMQDDRSGDGEKDRSAG